MTFETIKPLLREGSSKIVLLILDGLGGLPMETGGPTSLEAAKTPQLDRLANEGSLGQIVPIRTGITPGSGPAHLALFGYDPLRYLVARGVLEAVGVGVEMGPDDVAARGNFCTLDNDGRITDRRAGRIPSADAKPLVAKLSKIEVKGVDIKVRHLKEYRFALVMRGEALKGEIEDTDPQRTGLPPFALRARDKASQKTAEYFALWIAKAREALADQPLANAVTLRGFGNDPQLPQYADTFGLKAACIAVYPMYRGVARLVGMDVIDFEGEQPKDEFAALGKIWQDYDFFFLHIKNTDSMGEDGNFAGKREVIESVDQALPALLSLKPDVLVVTGDHSTPVRMRSHSWHPVPLLLWAAENAMPDQQNIFGERACALGVLGTFPATDIMPLALAHAGRLNKYCA